MAAAVVPLVKEPVQVLTRNFFQRKTDLGCLSGAVFIGLQIIVKSGIKSVITKIISQHVEYGTALVIGNPIEHILLGVIVETHQIFGDVGRVAEVTFRSFHEGIISEILTVFMLVPKVFGIVGEGFIHRQVAPALRGHKVPEPVVEKFMGNDVLPAVFINKVTRLLLSRFLMKYGSGIFHGTRNIITRRNLCIFGPGVIVVQFFGEELHHLRRIPENLFCIRFIFLFNIVIHGNAPPFVFHNRVFAHSHKEKIGSMFFIHHPVVGTQTVAFFRRRFHQSVRKRHIFVRDGHVDFLCGLLIRFVNRWEPCRTRFGLTLSPDLCGFLSVLALSIHEIKPLCISNGRAAFVFYLIRA